MTLYGRIIAGDADKKTITVECENTLAGIELGARVTIIQQDHSINPTKLAKDNLQPYETGGLLQEWNESI